MAKKTIKKYQTEGPVTKSKTVTKGPLGLTKTIVKTKTYADKDPVVTTKTRTTVKGALNNVASKFRRPITGGGAYSGKDNYPVLFPNFTPEERKKNEEEYLKRIKEKQNQKKVGGNIKKKK